MVRWTTLLLFLMVLTVTTDSLRVFPESIRLFYRLYKSVARGGRILRDIAEGAGTVSEAIKSIDDLLDRTVEDPPLKEKLVVTPSLDLPKKSSTTNSATQTGKPSTKKKEPVKPLLDDKIVVTQHVSDNTIVRKDSAVKDSSSAKVKATKTVSQVGTSSSSKIMENASVESPAKTSETSDASSPETKEPDHVTSTCKMSSTSSNDESCSRPTTSEPLEADLPSSAVEKSSITKPGVDPLPPSLNGCGALELHIKAPNLPVDKMTACCDAHDACYIGACKANKRVCDNMLRGCLFSICEDKAIKTAAGNLPNYCNAAAKLLFSGTMALSFHQYKEAQDQLKCRG